MKKIMMLLVVFGMLFAVACSNDTSDSEPEKDKNEQQVPEEEDDADEEEVESDEPEEEENGNESEKEKEETGTTETEEEEPEKDTEQKEEETEKEDKQESDDQPKEAANPEKELKDLGFEIFKAQKEEDYDFLKSILAKGASLDQSSKTFSFKDVTYPHDQEFIQVKQSDVEYRYIHEENDKNMTVGFAVVDYETESSFTIDFQFVKEKNKWKMKDMDMNK